MSKNKILKVQMYNAVLTLIIIENEHYYLLMYSVLSETVDYPFCAPTVTLTLRHVGGAPKFKMAYIAFVCNLFVGCQNYNIIGYLDKQLLRSNSRIKI